MFDLRKAAVLVSAVVALISASTTPAVAATGSTLGPETEYPGRVVGRYDYDAYTFYVVAPAPVPVHLSLWSPEPRGIEVLHGDVEDQRGESVGELWAPRPEGGATELDPMLPTGRYTVSVGSTFVGSPESYTLTTGSGSGGAFYSGEAVATNCAAAQGPRVAAQARLKWDQRTLRRHRTSAARSRVRRDRAALERAAAALEPWCGLLS